MRKHDNPYSWLRLIFMMIILALSPKAYSQNDSVPDIKTEVILEDSVGIKNVLFLGDSMTGWMAERFNAYGDLNGFEVATIVWDGSTISKWANSPRLADIISELKPDAVIISLGMNEMFETNPEKRIKGDLDKIKNAIDTIPFLWIGPPYWIDPEKGKVFNNWLQNEVGERNFFNSLNLDLPRQSKNNPHPSREGIEIWIDKVAEWIPDHSDLQFKSLSPPAPKSVSRGKVFIYKRMKEKL